MRVAPSLAFYGSDPMHLLRVPLLYIQYCTCLLHPFNELSGSVDYMKIFEEGRLAVLNYPLTAPSFSPEIKYLCIAIKNTRIGIVAIIDPAAI